MSPSSMLARCTFATGTSNAFAIASSTRLSFEPNTPAFAGPPSGTASTYTATAGVPLDLVAFATDEGPKINIPERGGRGRGAARGAAAGRGAEPAEPGAAAAQPPAAGACDPRWAHGTRQPALI